MSESVIKVENLSKQYRLGLVGTGTLGHDLNRLFARFLGKEDPYTLVGDTNDRSAAQQSEYVWALRDINFDVKQGEVLGIVGKNGAGKSTLLKILSQITTPTKGSVKIKGRVASLLEVGTGFHPELTGRENIYLNGAILGMRRWEISKKLDEIISFAGTEKYLDTPVKRYSSGMKVRLGFAVAAHLEPEILIVDEVLAVGDAEFQAKCLGKMGEISKSEGRTILFVSHNLSAVNNLCARSILIENGAMKLSDSTERVIEEYLGYSSSKKEHTFYKENTKKKKAEITMVKLEEMKAVFDVSQDISLNMQIEFNSECGHTFAAILLYDKKGNLVFISTTEDSKAISICDNSSKKCLRVSLPAYLMKPGEYSIHVSVYEKDFGNLDKIAPALNFEVIDQSTRRGMMNLYRRDAVVAPVLFWSEINGT